MRWRSSPAGQALLQAQAAAERARQTGCGIDEAGELVAGSGAGARAEAGPGRRAVLGGAGVAALAAGLPPWLTAAAAPAPAKNAPRVVIVGSGIAGLGCAYRLWREHGLRSEVYEFNADRPGGRIETLRGFFAGGQYAEQHGEFISSEHIAIRQLAASFGLHLDNVNAYPPHTRAQDNRMRFSGRFWSQQSLNRDWHEWGWQLFHDAVRAVPWPTLYTSRRHLARRLDNMTASEWIERNIPGGLAGDFGKLCVSTLLDEYGGPVDQQSALNLIYLLGFYDSAPSGVQPKGAPQLSGTDEKWHVRGGNDQIITRLIQRLPGGTVRLGERLIAVRPRGQHGYTAAFASGHRVRDVPADHVVLALPFTKLREADLAGLGLGAVQLRAIRREPLGSNAKVALQFTTRVWNAEHWTGTFYTDAMPQSGWEATIDQPGKAGIMIALPGGHAGSDLGRRYQLGHYEGPAPEPMVRDFLDVLERNFPGCRAAYNGRAHYVWSSGDPHVGGAYSYLAVGQYTGFNGVQSRRHGNLHFAGEHTSVNFQGYMEGALRSGYRCAAEIL